MKHLPVWHATLQTSLCCCFSVLLVGLSYVSVSALIHLLFLPYARVWHTILIKYMPRQRNQSHNYPTPARGIAKEPGMISYLPPSLPACLPHLLVVVLYFVIKSQAFGYSQGL